MKCILFSFLLIVEAVFVYAQEGRTMEDENKQTLLTRTFSVGINSINQLDTYLSPQEYTGTGLLFVRETFKPRGRFLFQNKLIVNLSQTANKTLQGNYQNVFADWNFGGYSVNGWRPVPNLNVFFGAKAQMFTGFSYNTRNGNNPANAYLTTNLLASVMAIYNFNTKINYLNNFSLHFQLDIPFFGICFTPNYGQSYYELFQLGYYDNNIRLTTPFNAPSLTSCLSLNIPLKNNTLRLSYLTDVKQTNLNNLKMHLWQHGLLIGYVKRFIVIGERDVSRKHFLL